MTRTGAIFLLVLLTLALVACGESEIPTVAPTNTAPPPTDTPPPPTETPDPAIAAAERGHVVFLEGGSDDLYRESYYCVTCHSLDGIDDYGPSLKGIAERAAERDPELTAEEYIRQSIVAPKTYTVEGYQGMSGVSARLLTEEEIEDVVAFLLTQ